MTPPPRATIPGSTSRQSWNIAVRFTASVRSHCSSVVLRVSARKPTPALFTNRSTGCPSR